MKNSATHRKSCSWNQPLPRRPKEQHRPKGKSRNEHLDPNKLTLGKLKGRPEKREGKDGRQTPNTWRLKFRTRTEQQNYDSQTPQRTAVPQLSTNTGNSGKLLASYVQTEDTPPTHPQLSESDPGSVSRLISC